MVVLHMQVEGGGSCFTRGNDAAFPLFHGFDFLEHGGLRWELVGVTEKFHEPACLEVVGEDIDVGSRVRTNERQVGNVGVEHLAVEVVAIFSKPDLVAYSVWEEPIISFPASCHDDGVALDFFTIA